jgi:hypothetical protein
MKIGKELYKFLIPVILVFSQCQYNSNDPESEPEVSYILEKVFDLPYDISESSGIIIYDSLLWTFNDSRNDAVIYGLDLKTGVIKKTIHFSNAQNKDWEDIAQDANFIYIGDFGNNYGSRQDLCIYVISKEAMDVDSTEFKIQAEKINFSYIDQTDFSDNYRSSSFDCEAFLCDGDSLILFTKDWVDQRSTVYMLPVNPGTYVATKCFKMHEEGLITGADYNLQKNTLLLCGYNNLIPFVLIKEDLNDKRHLEFNIRRIDLEDDIGIQLEGVACFNEIINLTSENSVDIQALYHLVKQ